MSQSEVHRIDIRGVVCPYTLVKAKLALEKMSCGEILEIYLDNKTALDNLPRAFIYYGQEFLGTEAVNCSEWIIRIRKRR